MVRISRLKIPKVHPLPNRAVLEQRRVMFEDPPVSRRNHNSNVRKKKKDWKAKHDGYELISRRTGNPKKNRAEGNRTILAWSFVRRRYLFRVGLVDWVDVGLGRDPFVRHEVILLIAALHLRPGSAPASTPRGSPNARFSLPSRSPANATEASAADCSRGGRRQSGDRQRVPLWFISTVRSPIDSWEGGDPNV